MRIAAAAGLALALGAGTAHAQSTTWCNNVGSMVMCNTQAPYQPAPVRVIPSSPVIIDNRPAPNESAVAQVAAFAADPMHPYFGIVRDDIMALVEAGQASTLKEAYDKAVAASPAVRALEASGYGVKPRPYDRLR